MGLIHLYSATSTSFDGNGTPLVTAREAVVKRDEGFQLTFNIPISQNELHKRVQKEMIVSAMTPDGVNYFRIWDIEKRTTDVKVTALQLLYSLDVKQINPFGGKQYTGTTVLQAFANAFKSSISPYTFSSSILTLIDFYTNEEDDTSTSHNALAILNKITDNWSGELMLNGFDVRMVSKLGTKTDALLYEHKNIASFSDSSSMNGIVTRIYATATYTPERAEDATEDPEPVVLTATVDSPLINQYAVIYEATAEYNDARTVNELRTEILKQYSEFNVDKPERTIDVDTNIVDGTAINFGDELVLKYLVHDVDEVIRCVGYEYDPISENYIGVTLGTLEKTFLSKVTEGISSSVSRQFDKLNRDIQGIQTAANGKNRIAYGPSPVPNAIEGDLWFYHPEGRPDEVELLVYQNGLWMPAPFLTDQDKSAIEQEMTDLYNDAKAAADAQDKLIRDRIDTEVGTIGDAMAQDKQDAITATNQALADAKAHAIAQDKLITTSVNTEIANVNAEILVAKQAAQKAYTDAVADTDAKIAAKDLEYEAIFDDYDEQVATIGDDATQAKADASQALEEAGISNDLAQSAKDLADTAKTNAQTALNNSSKAQTDASTAVSDASQAKADAQTAIAEAGQAVVSANTAKTNAQTALTDAQTALSTANNADTKAGLAETAANTAKDNAQTALDNSSTAITDAADAITKAGLAETTANTAKTNAQTAINSASTAVTNAAAAITKAGQAEDIANTAKTNAQTALDDAQSALTEAGNAKTATNTLSTKVDDLEGVVELKASQTEVDGIIGTVSTHTTTIGQHATAIASKAEKTVVDTLSGTVSNQGTLITQNATAITSKAATSVVDALQDTVDTHTTDISQNATDIASKASSTSVNALTGRVSTAETTITQHATAITSKADQTEVDTVKGTVSGHTTTLSQHATAISSKADSELVNTIKGTVDTHTTEISQNATAITSKANTATVNALTGRVDTAESDISQNATAITQRVTTTTYNTGIASKENTVLKQSTAPTHLNGKLWLDTSVTPNILKRSNGTTWIKATPTTPGEVGAYSQSDGAGLAGRLTTAETNITQTATDITSKADKSTVDTLSGTVSTHGTTIAQNATAIASKADQTEVDTVKGTVSGHTTTISQHATAIASKAESSLVNTIKGTVDTHATEISQNATDIASKASSSSVNTLTGRVDTAESNITQNATAITQRVTTNTYNAGIGSKENTVLKQTTAPAHLNGRLWLDTSVTPNILKRSTGTAWVKATPTTPGEVGAYSQSAGAGLAGRLTTAETNITQTATDIASKADKSVVDTLAGTVSTQGTTITQNATAIASKASQTEMNTVKGTVSGHTTTISQHATAIASKAESSLVNTIKGTVDTHTTDISQNATDIASKASSSSVNTLTGRVNTAESNITQNATAITQRVTTTTYNAGIGSKENTVLKQSTAPTHLNGRLWLDTSVTPNILKRSTGSAWVKATPTTASEVGAYSSSQGSALAGRVTTAETTITQTNTAITSKADKSVVDTLSGTVSTHGTTLTQHATAISSKAAQTEVDTVKGTVSGHTSTLSQHATQISARLTTTQVNSLVDGKGFATQTWANNQINATADGINATIDSVKQVALVNLIENGSLTEGAIGWGSNSNPTTVGGYGSLGAVFTPSVVGDRFYNGSYFLQDGLMYQISFYIHAGVSETEIEVGTLGSSTNVKVPVYRADAGDGWKSINYTSDRNAPLSFIFKDIQPYRIGHVVITMPVGTTKEWAQTQIDISAGSIKTELNSLISQKATPQDIANAISNDKSIKDTRSTNSTANWYQANYPKQVVREIKLANVIGVSGTDLGILTTEISGESSATGAIKQTYVDSNSDTWVRRSTLTHGGWLNWEQMVTNTLLTTTVNAEGGRVEQLITSVKDNPKVEISGYNQVVNTVNSMQQTIGDGGNKIAQLVMTDSVFQTNVTNNLGANLISNGSLTTTTGWAIVDGAFGNITSDGVLIEMGGTTTRIYNGSYQFEDGVEYYISFEAHSAGGGGEIEVGVFTDTNRPKIAIGRVDEMRSKTVKYKANGSSLFNIYFTKPGAYRIQNVFISKSPLAVATATQVSQLSDSWVLSIKSGNDIKTQINASTDSIRLESKFIHLSGTSLIDTAVIKSAHIDTLNASKVTGTTADFNTIRTGVLTANAVTATHIKSENALIDNIFANQALVDRLWAKTIWTNKITAMELNASQIKAGTIDTARLNASAIVTAGLTANVVKSTHIETSTLLVDKIFANQAMVDRLWSKAIWTTKLTAMKIDASQINAGTISVARLNAKEIVTDGLSTNVVKSTHISADTALFDMLFSTASATNRLSAETAWIKDANIIGLNANKITAGTISAARISTGSLANVEVGGRNLIIQSGSFVGYIEGNGVEVRNDNKYNSRYVTANFEIKVTAGETLTWTKKRVTVDNFWRYKWMGSSGGYISRHASDLDKFSLIVPPGAVALRVAYPVGSEPKIERGVVATAYSLAPEDNASKDELSLSGTVEIHGGNIKADTLDVGAITGNKATFISTGFKSLNSQATVSGNAIRIQNSAGEFVEMNNTPELRSDDAGGTAVVLGKGRVHFYDSRGYSKGYVGTDMHTAGSYDFGTFLSKGSGIYKFARMADATQTTYAYYTIKAGITSPSGIITNMVQNGYLPDGNPQQFVAKGNMLSQLNGWPAYPNWPALSAGQQIRYKELTSQTTGDAYEDIWKFGPSSNGDWRIYFAKHATFEGGTTGTSDRRLKHDIVPTQIEALGHIESLSFKEFKWNRDNKYEPLGLIAQDSGIIRVADDNMEGIDIQRAIMLGLKGLQELQELVKEQAEEIRQLKEINNQ